LRSCAWKKDNWLVWIGLVKRYFQQHFSYIVAANLLVGETEHVILIQ
jgi:hypothetical protein